MLTTSTYIEDFLESASGAPTEVVRSLTLLRELDARAAALQQRGAAACAAGAALTSAGPARADDAEAASAAGRVDLREAHALAAEKVAVARQAYDLVDRHIRRLDADLRRFESELDSDAAATGAAADDDDDDVPDVSGRHHHHHKQHQHHRHHHKRRTATPATTTEARPDMPIDPDEPVYCVCKQAAFGKMIECENPACPVEWYHYPCVGLSSSPKGHWFCPQCRVLLKRQEEAMLS